MYVFFEENQPVDVVTFWVNDPNRSSAPTQVEGSGPWDLRGGAGIAADANAKPQSLSELGPGVHTVTVQAVVGDAVHLETVTFAIDDFDSALPGVDKPSWDGQPAPEGHVVFDGHGRPLQSLDGNGISLADDADPYWDNPQGVDYVHYWIDDPTRSGPPSYEAPWTEPYSFGTDGLSVGTHTLTVVAVRGITVTEQTIHFTVEPEIAAKDNDYGHIDLSENRQGDGHVKLHDHEFANDDEVGFVFFHASNSANLAEVRAWVDNPFMVGAPDVVSTTESTSIGYLVAELDPAVLGVGDHSVTVLGIGQDGLEQAATAVFTVIPDS